MRTTNVTNDNIVIQARNEKDYARALIVADRMVESNPYMVVSCVDPTEYWVQITAHWRHGQASDFLEAYTEAKSG